MGCIFVFDQLFTGSQQILELKKHYLMTFIVLDRYQLIKDFLESITKTTNIFQEKFFRQRSFYQSTTVRHVVLKMKTRKKIIYHLFCTLIMFPFGLKTRKCLGTN